MAEEPMSRNEELLRDIIEDEPNDLGDPQSRNEAILMSIIDDEPYSAPAQSRMEGLLIDLKVKINNMIPEPTANIDITSNASNIDVKSYATANVSVPQGVFPSGVYSIAANGDYDVASYASAHVEVPQPSGVYSIATNGDYDIASYASAHVAVPMPSGVISITSNASNIDVASYAAANVNVPTGITPTGTFSITSNGVYDVASYASASVNVSGGGEDPLLSAYRAIAAGTGASGTVDLEDSTLTGLRSYAFAEAVNLKTVSFTNVATISAGAFRNCKSMTEAYLPNITKVPANAFEACLRLVSLQTSALKSIEAYAFESCRSLSGVNMSQVTSLSLYAFLYAGIEHVDAPLVKSIAQETFRECAKLETVNMPSASGILGSSAFNNCSMLSSIVLGQITWINQTAFFNCTSLTSIDLPYCGSVGNTAFAKCTGLEVASFGASFSGTSKGGFGPNAFSGCSKLSALYWMRVSTDTPAVSSNTFIDTPITNSSYLGYYGSIYVPSAMYSLYQASASWAAYMARIVSI